MASILWGDLEPEERLALAMLGTGISVEFCDRVALLTLMSIGLVRDSALTLAGKKLRRTAVLDELAAQVHQALNK